MKDNSRILFPFVGITQKWYFL